VHSLGFTLDEVSRILKSAGVSYALNLDGGGSSGIISSGGFWNIPSDGLERPVSYGIGAFQRRGR
jgi:exopolysaccharide biosynthesis protein